MAAAGRDVTFLVRRHRVAQLSRGLTIRSRNEDTVVPIKVIVGGQDVGPFDAILLAVKSYQLAAALGELRPYVGNDTMIVPTLNGMRHMDTLRAQFGTRNVIGGVAKLVASLDEQGRIIDQGSFHDLVYGEWNGEPSERIRALDRAAQGSGFDAHLSAHIERDMWEKWAMLASLGAITCLMDGDLGQVARTSGGVRFVERLFGEVVSVIAAEWQPLSEGFRSQILAFLTDRASLQTSSMYRDMKAGQQVEADQIIGDLVARGTAKGVATPVLSSALVRLQVYQQQQVEKRAG
jgi:2-dehydropantoate 2-reductase